MTEWVPRFDYPADEWLVLDVNAPDGPEQVARLVADRGGRQNKRYAKAVCESLKRSWEGAREDRVELAVEYVPHVRRSQPPLLPASFQATRQTPDYERTLETIISRVREPMNVPTVSRAREPEITCVELPAGPACRSHEIFAISTGHGDEHLMTEHVFYYLLPEAYPEEVLTLHASWASHVFGSVMMETADKMAASLTFVPRDSGERPRAVLPVPEPRRVFDQVQIGRGLRPLAQHGAVVVDEGVLSLLGSDLTPIDSAPIMKVRASKVWLTGGMTVSLTLEDRKYNVSPGWGAKRFILPLPGLGNEVAKSADALLQLIERGGGTID